MKNIKDVNVPGSKLRTFVGKLSKELYVDNIPLTIEVKTTHNPASAEQEKWILCASWAVVESDTAKYIAIEL